MARYLYSELATAVAARRNCAQTVNGMPKNAEWFDKWSDRIDELMDLMPSGSGFDSGTKIDLDASHAEKLVFTTAYHHMNDAGYYDGWTEHTITVTPSFAFKCNIRISGRNRNGIKEYIADTFEHHLAQEVEQIQAA